MTFAFNTELSDKECCAIGTIVSLWANLEHEIFDQTLETFSEKDELPKEMNNLNASKVRALWIRRVVELAEDKKKEVLLEQVKLIEKLERFRHALVHGMWDYDKKNPEKITSYRVSQDKIISIDFVLEDLADFAFKLMDINFKVRYPNVDDYLKERAEIGSYMSREFMLRIAEKSSVKESNNE